MEKLLISLTKELQRLLSAWLPALVVDDWWGRYVLTSLSHMQRQQAEQRGISKLSELDLTALLRVLDQNWFELSNHANIPKEARNWLKETQSIRNRWAHTPSGGWDDESTYRDLDTLVRLQQAIGVSTSVLNELHQEKQRILAKLTLPDVQTPQNTTTGHLNGGLCLPAR